MASLARFIAKDCRLQPCDAVYRPSTCLLQRRLQRSLVDTRGAFRMPENERSCLAIHSEPRSAIVALLAPILVPQPSRFSQVVCKAATNASSGDIPESPPSGMSQYEREDCIQLKEKIL
ncbi:sodium/pyruvate cotransporter BASS2, chloroplastic-like [Actinidia eriantha]|uniref:sodium/pyruvate cotransporter BASS2, chloroplastic-like n=1 Tax=Actinidia eriantha TaxID=165200 RepID=UPI0025835BBE|nr:sodium/pyruvate cotransporter BASS2, chloroplastic-like [Actinidia eriantha]